MVKLFRNEHTFQHPFDRVSSAFWRKYPNDLSLHVKAIDITNRRIDDQGRLITNRILSCHAAIPSWLTRAGLPQTCFVAESSVVDPASQTMVVKSSNLSGASLMTVEETCTYQRVPSITPTATSATHYRHEARITAFLPFLASQFESYSFANLQSKSLEGVAIVEGLCQRIQRDGVLSLLSSSSTPATSSATSSSSSD